ncbi:hypothetical protein [Chishuiella changwenlii]|uniref:hypothetical protein n=1 Tax=Chishuiella changwenlii TaxID=1434701 RepID=UPI002FDAB110
MKNLIFIICLFPVIGKSQSKNDTIFISKTENNKIYLDSNHQGFLSNIDINSENYFPIYSYNGKYYLYKPCDGYNDKNIHINDKSVTINIGEEQYFEISNKIENKQKTSYILVNESINTELEIKKINKKLYVIKFYNDYYLMTILNQVKKFPVIVNDCPKEKVDEFKFDNIDAKSLFESIK